MHPTGAVHAYDDMPAPRWLPNKRTIDVKLVGYVLDEMSISRDGMGIGVSFAYLLFNGTKIILRDQSTDLLDENGRFSVTIKVREKRTAIYKVEYYASDTVPAENGGPNSGLVDSTYIRVPHDMR